MPILSVRKQEAITMFIPIEFQKAHEKTKQSCIRMTATYTPSLSRVSSQFGGTPFWPASEALPTDSNDNLMALLVQINFADVPHHPDLPDSGILQIFIPPQDDYYGADFDSPLQSQIVVKYWKDVAFSESDLAPWHNTLSEDEALLPINGAHALQFNIVDDYAGIDTIECAEAMQANPFEVLEDIALNEKEETQFFEDIVAFTQSDGHKLLGSPYFIQGDPRDSSEYRLLLQIDTDMDEDNDIMWGDNGVGHFFIRDEDLAAQRFERLWFSWDSC